MNENINNISDEEIFEELKLRFFNNKNSLLDFVELADQLKVVNTKLEESENLKTHFLSNIRNQIINPFASILGLAKSITNMQEGNWQKAVRMSKLIYDEAFNLDFQLNNIFAAARIEAGEMQPEISQTNICEIAENVIEAFRHKADHKEIVIIFKNLLSLNDDGEFLFKTDPYQLQLILSNLLSNSIEYSYAASEIELEMNYVDNQLIVSFSDKGVGIDEKDQKIIFDRFTRLDTSINSIQQGHGLGLAITKNLIDALNGKIELVSRKRVGSVFKIFVPEGKENEFGEMYALNSDEFLFNDMENF